MSDLLFGSPSEQNRRFTPREIRAIVSETRKNAKYNRGLSLQQTVQLAAAALGISGYIGGKTLEYIGAKVSSFITPESNKRKVQSLSISPGNTKAKKRLKMPKRLRGEDSTEAEVDADGDVHMSTAVALKSSGGDSATKAGTKETPIIWRQPILGFPERQTVIIPLRFSLSGVLKKNESLDLQLQMNSLYSILATTVGVRTPNETVGVTTLGAQFAKGWYVAMIPLYTQNTTNTAATSNYTIYNQPNASRWTKTDSYAFNDQLTAATSPTPQWRSYFAKIYGKYSVIQTEWDITTELCNLTEGSDVLLGYGDNVSSATNTSTIYGTSKKLTDAQSWGDLKWQTMRSAGQYDSGDRFHKTSGTWHPGQGKRAIINDEDAKTWTSMGSAPDLKEEMQFMYFPANHNYIEQQSVPNIVVGADTFTNVAKTTVNVTVELKYMVQVSDLVPTLRYLERADAAVALTVPTDVNVVGVTAL